jgi:hypothetical protein
MFTRFSSATAETASSLTSSIHSTLTNTSTTLSSKFNHNYPNLSKNFADNYSNISTKVADNYNNFNENYPYLYSSISNTRSTINNGTTFISSIPSSIGDKIYSCASVIQPVDGSEEREITRTPPNENLGENVIPLSDERIELVNHILDLYHCKPSKECFKYFDDDVIYQDQIVYTIGLPDLKAQFYGTPKMGIKCTTINYKVLENTPNVLKISLNQKYTLPFVRLAVLLNNVIILEFNENKKIHKHTDLWYGKQPIYKGEILRKGAAKIVSTLVKVPEN